MDLKFATKSSETVCCEANTSLQFSFNPGTCESSKDGDTFIIGSTQKQPKTYKVGTTVGAPIAGESTWTKPEFANSWVLLWINSTGPIDLDNMGDERVYLSKNLASDMINLKIGLAEYDFVTDDILTFILITP